MKKLSEERFPIKKKYKKKEWVIVFEWKGHDAHVRLYYELTKSTPIYLFRHWEKWIEKFNTEKAATQRLEQWNFQNDLEERERSNNRSVFRNIFPSRNLYSAKIVKL